MPFLNRIDFKVEQATNWQINQIREVMNDQQRRREDLMERLRRNQQYLEDLKLSKRCMTLLGIAKYSQANKIQLKWMKFQ